MGQNPSGKPTFFPVFHNFWIFENAFSQRYINNFEEPPYQQLKGLSSPQKILRNFGDASQFWKTNKIANNCINLFIEGISMILKIQQVKLLQFEVRVARTPPWRIEVKFEDFLFLNDKMLQIWKGAVWIVLRALDIRVEQLMISQFNRN